MYELINWLQKRKKYKLKYSLHVLNIQQLINSSQCNLGLRNTDPTRIINIANKIEWFYYTKDNFAVKWKYK